jgi:ankyrin repeat protein
LENGNHDLKNSENITIFMMASKFGIDKIIMKMINAGIDVNFKDNNSMTALIYAIQSCRESTVELLLNSNAKIIQEDNGVSPELFSACHRANVKIVSMILDAGANINAEYEHFGNAFNCALSNYGEGEEIAEFLLKKGVNICNKYETPPLMHASLRGLYKIVKILIEMGVDINSVDNQGKTALMHASKFGNDSIVELLVKNGADVNIKNNKNRTALIYGAWRSHGEKCENIVKTLLDAKADVNIIDNSNSTALSYIIGYPKNMTIVKMMLDKHSNIKDKKVSAGIFHLIQQEFCEKFTETLEYMKYLIISGIDINVIDENGNTPLMYASGYNRYGGYTSHIPEDKKLEIVKILLDNNADINAKNNSGDTALSIALERDNDKIGGFLKNRMIEINLDNDSGIIEI